MEGRGTILRNRRTGEERHVVSGANDGLTNRPLLVPPFVRARQEAAEQARKEEEKRGETMTESFTDSVGQSSNSSFGSTLSFGQSTAAKNNSLAPKRFGRTFSLGSQSMSGGTSPGVIRSSQSSPTLTSESFTNSVGQSSNSSFGSTLSFGQSTAAKNNSLAPKRFGRTFSLGSQSMSGGTSPGAIRSSQSSPTLTSRPDFGVSRLTSFGSSKPAFEQGRKGDAKRGETMSGSSTNCGGKSLGNRSSKAGPVGRLGSLKSALASSSLLAGREQRSREEEKRSEEVLGLSTNSFGQSSFSLKEELARIDALFVDKESDDSGPRWWESTCWRAGESKALVFEFGADIEALLPKLRHAYYYIVPRLEELAAIEKVEPGYCSRVKNFVVGRYYFGSIRFIGETDVRGLDLESIIQFNNREVTVYMDDAKKPPVGQGLNKRAEISLYNVNCVDEVTGRECMEGNTLDIFVDVLKKKAEDLGAEFVSYDPYEAVWKFKVSHF